MDIHFRSIGFVRTAGSDDDAQRMGLADGIPQGTHHGVRAHLQGDVAGAVAWRIPEGTHDRQRGHEIRAFLLHQGQRLVVDPGAVLDAAYSCQHRRPDTAAPVGVRSPRSHWLTSPVVTLR